MSCEGRKPAAAAGGSAARALRSPHRADARALTDVICSIVGGCSCLYLRSQGGRESCEAPSSGPGLLLALGASGTSLLTASDML